MRTILYTRDGVGLFDHEGYVSHILDDATSARGPWTVQINLRTVGWRAECACGWEGPIRDSGGPNCPTDGEYDRVLDDWEVAHPQPLVKAVERAARTFGRSRSARRDETAGRCLRGDRTWRDLDRDRQGDTDAGGPSPAPVRHPS